MILPIHQHKDEIVAAVRDNQRLVISSPTGSGKSTQVPQMLLDAGLAGNRQITVLQPRRIAARMLARRVAAERGQKTGEEIGYQVRFDRSVGSRTRIVYETDGITLRSILRNRSLPDVGIIILDEFHERHLYADIILAMARRLQNVERPDLRVIVMSATIETERIKNALAPCAVVSAAGRTHPVTINYAPSRANLRNEIWETAAEQAATALIREPNGNVLIFMPGAYEIRRTIDALGRRKLPPDTKVLPLHGELSPEAQDLAAGSGMERKIVVSTNVAETSLTIEGVTTVIDSGLARKASYDPRRGINTLIVEPVSRASADQRAGRAGRTRAGQCIRLYSQNEFERRPAVELPELQRIDLAETVLQLKSLGVEDINDFFLMDAPDPTALQRATQLLLEIGAIDQKHTVTATGRALLRFPLHPRLGRMLLEANKCKCVADACLMAAVIEDRGLLKRNQGEAVAKQRRITVNERDDSDLLITMDLWRNAFQSNADRQLCTDLGIHQSAVFRIAKTRDQLVSIAQSAGLTCHDSLEDVSEALIKCLLTAYPDHVAQRLGGGSGSRCAVVHGRRGSIEKASMIAPAPLLVAAGISEISRRAGDVEVMLSDLSVIKREWLQELFPHALRNQRRVYFDVRQKRVSADMQVLFHDLVLESKNSPEISDEEAAPALAEVVRQNPAVLKNWDAKVEEWIARVNLVSTNCPELQIAPIDDDGRQMLLEQLCYGLRGIKELKQREVWPELRRYHSRDQRMAVETCAPERVTLSNGRTPRVQYANGAKPYIAQRVQELYDVNELPGICMGKVKLLVHILAPNHRPVQITDDLQSFWQTGYQQAKRDLKGRYPKHEWR